jgi:uncharacterized protein YjbI with pentapeptide repeats
MPDIITFHLLSTILEFDIDQIVTNNKSDAYKMTTKRVQPKQRFADISLTRQRNNHSNFSNAYATNICLDDCDFSNCNLDKAILNKGILACCNFSHNYGKNLILHDGVITSCNFDGSDFSNSCFSNVIFQKNISNDSVRNSKFCNCTLKEEVLDRCCSDDSKFSRCAFTYIVVISVNIHNMSIHNCSFHNNELFSCNISNIEILNCNALNFTLSKCKIDEETVKKFKQYSVIKLIDTIVVK